MPNKKILWYGFLTWFIPFLSSIPFVDPQGNFIIDQIFFKSIMIVIGSFVGVLFAVLAFQRVSSKYLYFGIKIGMTWIILNWMFDLILVLSGFFQMSIWVWFSQIGLRYVVLPIFTIGLGVVLEKKHR